MGPSLGIAMLALLLASGTAHATPSPRATVLPPEAMHLANAAPSIDVLIDRLLHALEAKDVEALHALRVTESEYRSFILPSSVRKGEPLQIFPERESKFFWDVMNTKSLYTGQALLRSYGGRAYTLEDVTYRKGHRTYVNYEAYGDPILTVKDDRGEILEIEIGSVVDVNGQFKFMAFNSD
jgi:hypothetical protein